MEAVYNDLCLAEPAHNRVWQEGIRDPVSTRPSGRNTRLTLNLFDISVGEKSDRHHWLMSGEDLCCWRAFLATIPVKENRLPKWLDLQGGVLFNLVGNQPRSTLIFMSQRNWNYMERFLLAFQRVDARYRGYIRDNNPPPVERAFGIVGMDFSSVVPHWVDRMTGGSRFWARQRKRSLLVVGPDLCIYSGFIQGLSLTLAAIMIAYLRSQCIPRGWWHKISPVVYAMVGTDDCTAATVDMNTMLSRTIPLSLAKEAFLRDLQDESITLIMCTSDGHMFVLARHLTRADIWFWVDPWQSQNLVRQDFYFGKLSDLLKLLGYKLSASQPSDLQGGEGNCVFTSIVNALVVADFGLVNLDVPVRAVLWYAQLVLRVWGMVENARGPKHLVALWSETSFLERRRVDVRERTGYKLCGDCLEAPALWHCDECTHPVECHLCSSCFDKRHEPEYQWSPHDLASKTRCVPDFAHAQNIPADAT
jgi:hypothetical protein